MKTKKQQNKTKAARHKQVDSKRQPLVYHLGELRQRFFWIAAIFVVASALAYPFYHDIIQVLFAPLHGRQLVYLTPIGGFSFIIKVCTYIGIIFAVPAIVYHCYKFLLPVVPGKSIPARRYFLASMVLALIGVAFAYFILLPAAIQFLTTIDLQQVSAMLTVDSYLSFVIAYLIGCALMFQLPLIILLINSVHKIGPGSLMKYQRHLILAAFIFAAVLSPTPDVINQSLMAAPVIVLYQLGIVLLIIVNRKRVVDFAESSFEYAEEYYQSLTQPRVLRVPVTSPRSSGEIVKVTLPKPKLANMPAKPRPMVMTTDGFVRRKVAEPLKRPQYLDRPKLRPLSSIRSVDGIFMPQSQSGAY